MRKEGTRTDWPRFRLGAHGIWLGPVLFSLFGCSGRGQGDSDEARIESTPLAPRSAGGATLYELLSAEATGIQFENHFEWGHPKEHLYPHGFAGGGVCVGD
jgi:hypothetical protein